MPDFVLFTEASVQLQAAQACPCFDAVSYMCTELLMAAGLYVAD